MSTDHSESLGLTVTDHGLVMRAILDKPLHVLGNLDEAEGPEHGEERMLDAASKVATFDAETRTRLRKMRALYPDLAIGKRLLPSDFFEPIRELEEALDGKSIEETISIVTQTAAEENGSVPLATVYDLAARLLADAAGGIYAPDAPEAELLESYDATMPMFRAAVNGALTGGASAYSGMGETAEIAAAGAAAGAAGSSASAFVDALLSAEVLALS